MLQSRPCLHHSPERPLPKVIHDLHTADSNGHLSGFVFWVALDDYLSPPPPPLSNSSWNSILPTLVWYHTHLIFLSWSLPVGLLFPSFGVPQGLVLGALSLRGNLIDAVVSVTVRTLIPLKLCISKLVYLNTNLISSSWTPQTHYVQSQKPVYPCFSGGSYLTECYPWWMSQKYRSCVWILHLPCPSGPTQQLVRLVISPSKSLSNLSTSPLGHYLHPSQSHLLVCLYYYLFSTQNDPSAVQIWSWHVPA